MDTYESTMHYLSNFGLGVLVWKVSVTSLSHHATVRVQFLAQFAIRVVVTGSASPRYSLRRHLPAGVVHLPMRDATSAPVSALLSAV